MATPQLYKTTGIVLKRRNVGEGDKIITVFCERLGKKRFIGKGIRKISSRRGPHLEVFSKTDFLIHRGKTMDIISGAVSQIQYAMHISSLPHMAASYTAIEVIDACTPDHQEQDDIFRLLDGFLADIPMVDEKDIPQKLSEFIVSVLTTLGFRRADASGLSLGNAIASAEHVAERKIRSASLLSKSGTFFHSS